MVGPSARWERSWPPATAADRGKKTLARERLALFAIYSDAERVPLEVLARLAGNEGYISARRADRAAAMPKPDTVGSATASAQSERESGLRSSIGWSVAERAWGFPLRQQGVQSARRADRRRLEPHVCRPRGRTFGRASRARRFRLARPEVVVTSAASPGGDDPLGHLVNQVVLRAVADAGNPQKFPEQIRAAGLAAWTVKKVAGSLPPGRLGTINVNTTQLAPRLTRSLADYARRVPAGLIRRSLLCVAERLGLSSASGFHSARPWTAGLLQRPDARRRLGRATRAELPAGRPFRAWTPCGRSPRSIATCKPSWPTPNEPVAGRSVAWVRSAT